MQIPKLPLKLPEEIAKNGVDGNGGGGGGICLTSALLLNIGNAGGGTNRCFLLLFLLYNIIDIKFILDILFCRSYFL